MTTAPALADLIPAQYVPVMRNWLATQILLTCDARDAATDRTLPQLGLPDDAIAAHRQATAELRAVAERWTCEPVTDRAMTEPAPGPSAPCTNCGGLAEPGSPLATRTCRWCGAVNSFAPGVPA